MYLPAELSKGGRVHLAIDQEHQKHGEYQVLTGELQLSDPLLRQRGSSSFQRNIPPVRRLLENIIRPSVRRQADDDQELSLIIGVALDPNPYASESSATLESTARQRRTLLMLSPLKR